MENNMMMSQNLSLDTAINFQGFKVKLSDLITDHSKKFINSETSLEIPKKEEINIGKQIEGLKDIQNYYINRKLTCKMNNGNNVYLLSEISEQELYVYSGNQKFDVNYICEEYLLSSENESLTENESNMFHRLLLLTKNIPMNIYLLKKECGKLNLLKKTKVPFKIQDFENIINSESNCEVNLVSAIAGAGKSTLFTNMSRKVKEHNPTLWVIEIDLNSVSKKLKEIKTNDQVDIQTAAAFLHHAANIESELEKSIFEYYVSRKSIVLFLDGFDEIRSDYKQIILKIIEELAKNTKIKQIWISTRPCDSILEDMKFSFENVVFKHYEIESFTENDYKEYLKNFWNESIIINEKFDIFVRELFILFKNNDENTKIGSFGLVLHISMIGVILKNSFEEFQNSDLSKLNKEQEQKILEMLQLSKLYEKFVELKYNVYCENRSKLNLDTEMGKSIVKDDSLDNIIKKLKHFALDSLYNENHLKVFLTETEIRNLNDKKDDVKENGDELGITNRIVDGKTHFIHKTFSEYFAAAFFVENLMKENQKSKIIIEYFLKNMMNAENSAICKFIDSMLDDKILHCTNYDEIPKMEIGIIFFVLKNNWQNIAKFLIDGGINLMGIHENNSVLHLASTLTIRNLRGKEKSILKLIVEKLKSNETEFKILLETKDSDGRTPLFLAIEYGRLDNLKILINTCKEYKILCNVLMEENCNENMLHVAVEENCVDDVLNYILDLLKNEPEKLKALLLKRSDKDDTPLSKATMNRQSNKLKAMLDVCHSHKILDNVFAAENRWGENVFHQAAGKYCHDKVFIHILDLLKSNPEKLKALLVKRSKNDDTPLDLAAIYGQSVKLKSMLDVCHELKILDSVFANENEKGESLLHLAVDGYWEDDIFIYLLNLLKCEPKNLENLLLKKDDDCTYLFLNRASCYAQWNKLKAMLDVCHDFNILDCILTNENRRGESLFHQAVREFWEDNVFIYLVDFFKNKPEKLKSILLKKNHCGYSPVDLPLVYHQSNKLEIMMKACQISESG